MFDDALLDDMDLADEFGDMDLEDESEESADGAGFENDEAETNEAESEEELLDDFDIEDDEPLARAIENSAEESGTPEVEENAQDYSDGTPVEDDLHEEDEGETLHEESSFISDTGNIVVQDTDDNGNGFSLVYIPIENIAITQRIRKIGSVEGLVKSIKSTGLLKPIVVAPTLTDNLYVLLDGYQRIQACARAGKTVMPCIVNNRVNTPEIPILEAMYNHSKKYSIKEQVDYIDYLENQKGIMNPSMIEYLLQMNSGDYTKLKDILDDNDDDIVTKMFDGVYDIATAFKKLEQRRKKESQEEKENKKAAKVYENEETSGAAQIEGSGEEAEGEALSEEQIKSLAVNLDNLDDEVENESLNDMVEKDNNIEGFEPHKQKTGEREFIDPAIKKSAMARDNFTCRCCNRGGEQYVDILDAHHVVPVFLGGVDSLDNTVMLCVACHRLVHLYSTGDLNIDPALSKDNYDELTEDQQKRYENKEIFEDEKRRFKKIIVFGGKIRQGIANKGMNREKYKKEHPNTGIGRRKPGAKTPQDYA